MKVIGTYKNGNYFVTICEDGTKIRQTNADEFIPAFAESQDIKICDRCSLGCPYCHEGSTPDGKLADIMSEKFIESMHPYQECAIGGGDITCHPDLVPFLRKLKEKKVIPSITVNQIHFMEKQDLMKQLVAENLVYGIGVSLTNPTDEFIKTVKQYDNAVIHTINGILTEKQINKIAGNDLKVLILGYKKLRRGKDNYAADYSAIKKNQDMLYARLPKMPDEFKVVSFDNLAIDQLNVRRLMSPKEWDEFYMGDDSEFTFYIDMVNRQFSKSSTSPFDQRYPLMDNIDDMFERVRKKIRRNNVGWEFS